MSFELIKEFEGYSDKAYQDVIGVWTIGWGHTKGVKEGDTCTPEQAQMWLNEDLYWVFQTMMAGIHVQLTTNMREALQSFIYNVGGAAFLKSTMLKKLNAKDYLGAADEFPKWCKAGGKVIQGLLNRRLKEQSLFLEGYDESTFTNSTT